MSNLTRQEILASQKKAIKQKEAAQKIRQKRLDIISLAKDVYARKNINVASSFDFAEDFYKAADEYMKRGELK